MKQRRTVVGKFLGREVAIEWKPRRSTEDRVDAGRLRYGNSNRTVDLDRLPGRLERLLPDAYLHAPIEAWEPFVREAMLQGMI